MFGAYNNKTAKYVYTVPTQGTGLVDAAASRWKFPELRSLSNTKRRERKGLMKSLPGLCYWDLISSKMHRKASVPMFGDVTLI